MSESEAQQKNSTKTSVTYRDAGVDLDTYQDSMSRLPKLMHRTFTDRVMQLDGGFAGLFRLDNQKRLFSKTYRDPVLVSGTDGVGSKLQVAQLTGRHDTVGIDLVAMCVNDIICCGAEPLFFLDYIAMSHDDPETLEQVVSGISEGCLQAESALLGGETAIMPDLYQRGHYDLAGFSVGVVERKNLIDGKQIADGDIAIGIHSNGLHSNGFSLVRKIVFEIAGLSANDHIEQLGATVGETLLTPTRIYSNALKHIFRNYRVKNVVHGVAHITGGGIQENIERILHKKVDVQIDRATWTVPPVFNWVKELGNVEDAEMDRVFNMGIGLVLLVSPFYADKIQRLLNEVGYENSVIGQVHSGSGKVEVR